MTLEELNLDIDRRYRCRMRDSNPLIGDQTGVPSVPPCIYNRTTLIYNAGVFSLDAFQDWSVCNA